MGFYAKFLIVNKDDGEIVEADGINSEWSLGSDHSLDTWVYDAKERMDYLRNVEPKYMGFKIKARRINTVLFRKHYL